MTARALLEAELPELPEPYVCNYYLADQLRDYAINAVKLACAGPKIIGTRNINGVHVIVAQPSSEFLPEQLLVRYDDYQSAIASSLEGQSDHEVRLWDSQWVNIVNHQDAYRDMDKDEAVAIAVRLTERAMAVNMADKKFPPPRQASTKDKPA